MKDYKKFAKEVERIIGCYNANICPECGDNIIDNECKHCEQYMTKSVWMYLIDIAIDNYL